MVLVLEIDVVARELDVVGASTDGVRNVSF